ncbi:uncharacterized protein BT62DRAFT_1013170 [Guyanagaster necrorhizus]|uniref:Uncharacterized protein n=1 Tax=Guyanagaster necrorhizus TaxID=856835 RepID=A0A9P7VGA3_9AGAR|nr:uncharacterized protein BT62DRAFT_1013170 [Guyanagaster necrorhizus MCA 3950]KAG7440033.1 hypothetical protein BT62DRAFT_1013170 [Guyanagaster necrorhizus MCA 3950]
MWAGTFSTWVCSSNTSVARNIAQKNSRNIVLPSVDVSSLPITRRVAGHPSVDVRVAKLYRVRRGPFGSRTQGTLALPESQWPFLKPCFDLIIVTDRDNVRVVRTCCFLDLRRSGWTSDAQNLEKRANSTPSFSNLPPSNALRLLPPSQSSVPALTCTLTATPDPVVEKGKVLLVNGS